MEIFAIDMLTAYKAVRVLINLKADPKQKWEDEVPGRDLIHFAIHSVTHMYYTPMQVLQTLAGTVGVSRLLYIYYIVCWISKEVKFLNVLRTDTL